MYSNWFFQELDQPKRQECQCSPFSSDMDCIYWTPWKEWYFLHHFQTFHQRWGDLTDHCTLKSREGNFCVYFWNLPPFCAWTDHSPWSHSVLYLKSCTICGTILVILGRDRWNRSKTIVLCLFPQKPTYTFPVMQLHDFFFLVSTINCSFWEPEKSMFANLSNL